jgi:hypothetical protein
VSGPGGASVWFQWTGIQELVDQFATLAQDLTTAAAPEVDAAAQAAKQTIYAGYPTRTGDLKNHLAVVVHTDATRTEAVVINTSPHAAVFERGSQARHTAIGAYRGSMPANPLFSATLIRARRGLYAGPIPQVLEDVGLTVTGHA